MLRSLRVQNFKSIRDSGQLEIRPLTFLMGPNSAGKSSIIQPLLMLRQTVDSREVTNPLSIHGKYADFGSYRDFIFQQNDKNNLEIEFRWRPRGLSLPVFPAVRRRLGGFQLLRAYPGAELGFGVKFGYIRKSMRVVLESATFDIAFHKQTVAIRRKAPDQCSLRWSNGREEVNFVVGEVHKFYGATPSVFIGDKQKLHGLEWTLFARSFMSRLAQSIDELFGSVIYIGPLREWPKRFYLASGETPQDVGLKGELAFEVLWVKSRRKASKLTIFPKVVKWMKAFGVASELSLRAIGANTYELRLRDPTSGLLVNLADAGFGASQVFPVLVEGFYAPKGSVLLMEQPEIHLHPRAQATVADLLIEIAKEGKTLLIETHSEHLISRIQRRVAEGALGKDDVLIYYCEPSPEGTMVRKVPLTAEGQFELGSIPEGFFEEDFTESFEHLKAIVSRRKQPVPS